MRTRVIVACLAASLLAGAPADARVPGRTPRRQIESRLRQTLAAPEARGATPGVLAVRGGVPLVAVNADRPMAPASLAKLATTTAALLRFGPTARFPTRVVGARPVAGVVTGGLALVGGGDPTFATETYRREHFLPKPDDPIPIPTFRSGSPTVEQLAAAVARAGVRRVVGDLVVDESLFDSQRTQPGWLPIYQTGEPDIANISALPVNEGFLDLDQMRLAPSPPIAAGDIFRQALAARGIAVTGGVRAGRIAPRAHELARVLSPPLSEIVFWTNRWSINYPAELLMKNLGARFGGAGTTAAGARVVRATLARAGIPTAGLALADGSGLSTFNRITPRTIAAIISFALNDRTGVGAALRDSFPVAGGPGTLFKRMTKAPTGGNLRGKTGFIRHVRAMAGWVTAADGTPVVYVVMFNGAARPIALTSVLDLFGIALALFPYA
jgi:D-alanyl-D-alanine carboxypeptidase/D-alanyl-D-alanine-endopeptidase (penicillin-binding protein 4)